MFVPSSDTTVQAETPRESNTMNLPSHTADGPISSMNLKKRTPVTGVLFESTDRITR